MPLSCALLGEFAIGHGLCCYGNIMRTQNISEYMLVLTLCLVLTLALKLVSSPICLDLPQSSHLFPKILSV